MVTLPLSAQSTDYSASDLTPQVHFEFIPGSPGSDEVSTHARIKARRISHFRNQKSSVEESKKSEVAADKKPRLLKVLSDTKVDVELDQAEAGQSVADVVTEPENPRVEALRGLLKTIEDSEGLFEEVADDRFTNARAGLQSAMQKVERMLDESSTEVREEWKEYLQWDDLKEQIDEQKPSTRPFNAVIRKLSLNQPGIEREPLLLLRSELKKFKNASVYANFKNLDKFYTGMLKKLAATIEKEIENPSIETAQRIGWYAGILEDAQQAPNLTQEIRQLFSKSNLYAFVSERLICNLAASRPIVNTTPVCEEVLGTMQVGEASTRGTLLVDLVPNLSAAEICVNLEGITDSRVVGTQEVPVFGQIQVYGEGKTRVQAESRLFLDGNGMTNSLAEAKANTNTRITGVCSPTIIRQIVKREIHKQKDKGNYIATRTAEQKIRDNMDEQVMEAIDKLNERLRTNLLLPQLRLDAVPQRMNFLTTDDTLCMELMAYGQYQSSAMTSPPEFTRRGDLMVQVHESLVANQLEKILARQTLSSEQIVMPGTPSQSGNESESTEVAEEREEELPWEIEFASFQPVVVKFQDGKMKATIELKSIQSEETVVRNPLLVSATYKLVEPGDAKRGQTPDDGLKLVREGDVELLFKKRPTTGDIAVKGNLVEPFQDLFPVEIPIAVIEIPDTAQVTGNVTIRSLQFDNGWMTMVADVEAQAKPQPAAN